MASEEQIRKLMVKSFPNCPLCGSDRGYNVTSVFKGSVQCKSCSAEWSSIDFVKSTKLTKLRIRELPGGVYSCVRGEHVLRRRQEYPVSFWKSLGEIEERKVGLPTKALSEIIFLSLILLLAAHLRVANLNGFFNYDYDEGVYTESARMIVKGNLPYVHVFSSQPPHFILLIAAFLRLFGMNIMIARLFIVATSLIGIISVHLIAKKIEDFKAGLVAAFVLSISPYFLRQSRSVQSEVPSISFVLLGVWLFFEGFERNDNRRLLMSGVAVCLGAMMKLNVGLAVPLILILLIVRRNLRGAAFFIFGCIIPLLILPLFDLRKVIDQMVIFHFSKPATGTLQNRWARIFNILGMDVGLAVTALIGMFLSIIKKGLEGKFTVVLTVCTFLFLLSYRSFFPHQAVTIVPLLAIMSGVALVAPINFGLKGFFKEGKDDIQNVGGTKKSLPTKKRKSFSILEVLILLNFMLALFYCMAATGVVKYDLGLISPRENPRFRDAVNVIKAYTDGTDCVITDEQILAFFADRDVPPDLVDTSHMRISSGYLDSETVIELAEQYRVKVIVLWTGRLKRLKEFVNYVELNYQLVKDYGGGHEIYVRY